MTKDELNRLKEKACAAALDVYARVFSEGLRTAGAKDGEIRALLHATSHARKSILMINDRPGASLEVLYQFDCSDDAINEALRPYGMSTQTRLGSG